MKRKTRKLIDRARNIEGLQSPVRYRPSRGVLLMMNHAFEMLFKAVVFEKTGRIRAKKEKYNYGFEKCLAICQTQIKDKVSQGGRKSVALKAINIRSL
jgi:hypothetical protein